VSIPSFEERVQQWSHPPVDDIGYRSSRDMLAMDMVDLNMVIRTMAANRYNGWRNYQNRWRSVLGLDSTRGQRVLDYGCGVGLEALEYAKAGNSVDVADISEDNVRLAMRVLRMNGFDVGGFQITDTDPVFVSESWQYDVIHCVGVLHHIPEPIPVVKAMAEALVPGGELRLMVYSDQAWKIATGWDPEPLSRAEESSFFERYWQHWDPHGGYADWYDEHKLTEWFGEWFTVARYEPLTEQGEYVGAILVKR